VANCSTKRVKKEDTRLSWGREEIDGESLAGHGWNCKKGTGTKVFRKSGKDGVKRNKQQKKRLKNRVWSEVMGQLALRERGKRAMRTAREGRATNGKIGRLRIDVRG